MKYLIGALVFSIVLTTGCSSLPPVQNLALDKSSIQGNKQSVKVGIISNKIPKPTVSLPGANCMLCIAVASIANNKLSTHIESLSTDIFILDNMLLDSLKSQGVNASLISEEFNFSKAKKISVKKEQLLAARLDFRELGKEHNLTHIIVLNIYSHGAVRNYSNYIPVAPPYASVTGNVYMIDLSTNQYVSNTHIDQRLDPQGRWDNSPTYPELTNAYYSVVETVKENNLEAFNLEDIK